ncbi:MAG: hypothetical protein HFE45_01115 [Oscillospiraceae bacterium]|jgi:hypothetical protein|nr:hypothetical protein [Oscillospiraceae bacterium]
MSKLRNMRVIEIPKFRAVSSGEGTLGEIFGNPDGFSAWIASHRHLLHKPLYEPVDFLWHEGCDINRSVWIWALREGVTAAEIAPYQILEFPGGLFLAATADENDNDDLNETVAGMRAWIAQSKVFEYGSFPESGMCNMPNPDGEGDKALGIAQQQIFLPLKPREPQRKDS